MTSDEATSERSARKHRDAVKALGLLEGAGHAARLAGGCVRDRLLGHAPEDYDVATDAAPDRVMAVFRAAGCKAVPTGVEHGTVTIVMPSGPVEVTTLRIDVATDGRHATVAFGTSFEEDAARRDFTVNAMFEDASGQIFDYFAGQRDLKDGVLRFVGEPARRLAEDYLRIMRCFRFWARFGFSLAPGTLEAMAQAKDGLERISQERITAELLKTFAGAHLEAPLQAMARAGIWREVLPEVPAQPSVLAAWPEAHRIALASIPQAHRGVGVFAWLMIMAEVPATAVPAITTRLRLSTADAKRIAFLIGVSSDRTLGATLAAPTRTSADALDFIDAAEVAAGESMHARFVSPVLKAVAATSKDRKKGDELNDVLRFIDASDARVGHRRTAKLPLDGAAIMKHLGLPPGPELGTSLAALKRAYRNEIWTSPSEGLAWLDGVSQVRAP